MIESGFIIVYVHIIYDTLNGAHLELFPRSAQAQPYGIVSTYDMNANAIQMDLSPKKINFFFFWRVCCV